MKAHKIIDFTFTDDEVTTVQSFLDLLKSFSLGDGRGEEWEALNKQATDMTCLYVLT